MIIVPLRPCNHRSGRSRNRDACTAISPQLTSIVDTRIAPRSVELIADGVPLSPLKATLFHRPIIPMRRGVLQCVQNILFADIADSE